MGKTNQIFISYSRHDITHATKLYHELKKYGLTPWMDNENLQPGQKWKFEINQAIQNSSYFIALLSSESLSRRGFVQKELKVAMDILDQNPHSDIFIIPVRIDDCHPNDERLNEIHWVDLFPSFELGIKKILTSIFPKTNDYEELKISNNNYEREEEKKVNLIKTNQVMNKKSKITILTLLFVPIIIFILLVYYTSKLNFTNDNLFTDNPSVSKKDTTSNLRSNKLHDFNLIFDYDKHAWCIEVGYLMGRLELLYKKPFFDQKMNDLLLKTQIEVINNIKSILNNKGITLQDDYSDYKQVNLDLIRDIKLLGGEYFSFYMIGMASIRISLGNEANNDKMIDIAKSCILSIPAQYIRDKDKFFNQLLNIDVSKIIYITDFLYSLNGSK